MKKTIIYALSSLLMISIGIVLILFDSGNAKLDAIGTSLVAGGLASLAFTIIRYFDETDAAGKHTVAQDIWGRLSQDHQDLERTLGKLRTEILSNAARDCGRIYARRPAAEIRQVMDSVDKHTALKIDALGMSLKPFFDDFIPELCRRGNVEIRLLTMDPLSDTFRRFCKDQVHNEVGMVKEIVEVTAHVLGATYPELEACADQNNGFGEVDIQIKWDPGFQSTTLIRVNEVFFVRTRLFEEARGTKHFFERYYKGDSDGRYFQTFKSYFMALWERSQAPDLTMCREVVSRTNNAG